MAKTNQLATLREHDAMLKEIRKDLHLDPGAYVDVVFFHHEEGLVADVRCLGCEGPLELDLKEWWCCRECGYEFSPEEMGDLFARYHDAILKMAMAGGVFPERKKKRWVWVRWLLRLLRITR